MNNHIFNLILLVLDAFCIGLLLGMNNYNYVSITALVGCSLGGTGLLFTLIERLREK